MIIIVLGLPGSGKSYFATQLAEIIKADYINSDQVRRTAYDINKYTIEGKLSVYNEMLSQMLKAVALHKNVVLDATFYTTDIRNMFLGAAEGKDDVIFIEIRAERSLIMERLRKPRRYSEADFEVYETIKKQWEPLRENHLILQSTDNNIGEMLKKAIAYLHSTK